MISLDKTSLEKLYKVIDIKTDFSIKRRLLDVGIVPGASIEKIFNSPFGGMSAYSVMGTSIGIRDIDAKGILVIDEEV